MSIFTYNEKEARDLHTRLSKEGVKVKIYQRKPETCSWARLEYGIGKAEVFALVDTNDMVTMIITARDNKELYYKLERLLKNRRNR